jgi:hypothetical protein
MRNQFSICLMGISGRAALASSERLHVPEVPQR